MEEDIPNIQVLRMLLLGNAKKELERSLRAKSSNCLGLHNLILYLCYGKEYLGNAILIEITKLFVLKDVFQMKFFLKNSSFLSLV